MKCLNCGEEMINHTVQTKKNELSYDACESCGSLWLDAGELDKMAFKVKGSIEFCSTGESSVDEGALKDCPRCDGEKLQKVKFLGSSDVVLDHCESCSGFWLDGGELDLVNNRLEKIMPVKGKGFSDFINNVHLPFWNKRTSRPSSESDFKVEAKPIEDAKLLGESDKICPTCRNVNLNKYTAMKTEIEACPECLGVWLDKDELRRLKDRSLKWSWSSLNWMDDDLDSLEDNMKAVGSTLLCPKCRTVKMATTSFGDSDVYIEWCPACSGFWLDKGEFARIIEYTKQKMNNMSQEDLKKHVVQEIKEVWDGPEGRLAELGDAVSAAAAYLNLSMLQHPKLLEIIKRFPLK